LLRLKSVTHHTLKSVCRFRRAQPSANSAKLAKGFRPHCLLLFLCAMFLVLGALPLAVANAKTVTLGWDSNDEPDLEGYVIYRNTNSPGPPYSYSDTVPEDELADPLYPKATLTGLQEGKEYYIALTAYNTEGVESSFSNDVCVEVVNGIAELCGASSSPISSPISSSGGSGGSGGGSGGGSVCFISTASYRPPNIHLLFYILSTLTIIGIVSRVYRTKPNKQSARPKSTLNPES
jgi:hypothetical protein